MRVLVTIAGLVTAATLTACGTTAPQQRSAAAQIGDRTLRQFEAGVTTEAWLLAILGEPTSKAEVEGIPGAVVFRYGVWPTDDGTLAAPDFKNATVVYFIVIDGVVVRFWADRGPSQGTTFTGVAEEAIPDLLP